MCLKTQPHSKAIFPKPEISGLKTDKGDKNNDGLETQVSGLESGAPGLETRHSTLKPVIFLDIWILSNFVIQCRCVPVM